MIIIPGRQEEEEGGTEDNTFESKRCHGVRRQVIRLNRTGSHEHVFLLFYQNQKCCLLRRDMRHTCNHEPKKCEGDCSVYDVVPWQSRLKVKIILL